MENNLKQHETNVADAIRTKKGTTAKINPQNFASEILNIPTGGGSGSISHEALTLQNGDSYTLLQENQYGSIILNCSSTESGYLSFYAKNIDLYEINLSYEREHKIVITRYNKSSVAFSGNDIGQGISSGYQSYSVYLDTYDITFTWNAQSTAELSLSVDKVIFSQT